MAEGCSRYTGGSVVGYLTNVVSLQGIVWVLVEINKYMPSREATTFLLGNHSCHSLNIVYPSITTVTRIAYSHKQKNSDFLAFTN